MADELLIQAGKAIAYRAAGLRKLGHEGPGRVKLATLEETGHISAVEK
jgi:uncharacterized membrane protein YcaP (DUF421 family)